MISAEIVAHSSMETKLGSSEICSFILTFPRYILAELNTHRIFSRNSASSRAIPTKKMLEMIKSNPFVPLAWQKEHTGMQGTEYFTDPVQIQIERSSWLADRDFAIESANVRLSRGVTKQMCNRLLEPFMWHRALVTSTEWENFFELRSSLYNSPVGSNMCRSIKEVMDILKEKGLHRTLEVIKEASLVDILKQNKGQADIHFMLLVEAMWDALRVSTPKKLEAGAWHIPFRDRIDANKLRELTTTGNSVELLPYVVKTATGMAARTSYTTVGDEKEMTYETLVNIHNRMLAAKPFHASPFEHLARAMNEDEFEQYAHTVPLYRNGKIIGCDIQSGWCRNFRGFIQYREFIEKGLPAF